MIDRAASIRGQIVCDMMAHITKGRLIGKKIKNGELRKRLVEPEWKVPDCFTMTHIDLENFSMKLLASKENPNTDKIIMYLPGCTMK